MFLKPLIGLRLLQLREWLLWGLPTDNASIENAICTRHSQRTPLMLDPQGQADAWVKAMEARAGMQVMKQSQPGYSHQLETCVRDGIPVLIEHVGDTLDPFLNPLLLKQVGFRFVCDQNWRCCSI